MELCDASLDESSGKTPKLYTNGQEILIKKDIHATADRITNNEKMTYLGDMGDSVCPALKTERSRNGRCLERVGASMLDGI